MSKYTFRHSCGYMGVSYYYVYGDGELYEVQARHTASDYERSIFNGTDAMWERDILPMIGLLCANRYKATMAPDVAEAFNAWREAEYWKHRRDIDSKPETYGVVDWENDAVFKKPIPVRGANYEPGYGWRVIETADA